MRVLVFFLACTVLVPTCFSVDIIDGSNSLGINLFDKLQQNSMGNFLLSPASIQFAMSMALLGAGGSTATALSKGLGFSTVEGASLDSPVARQDVFAQLRRLRQILAETKDERHNTSLHVANSAWVREGVQLEPSYLQECRDHLSSDVFNIDMDSSEAADRINSWVSSHTNGKIPTIVSDIPRQTIAFLINAIYFKDTWISQFRPENTNKAAVFHPAVSGHPLGIASRTSPCEMMRKDASWRYWSGPLEGRPGWNLQAIELPYWSGFVMDVMMPRPDNERADASNSLSLSALMKSQLQAAALNELFSNKMASSYGHLELPKFKFAYDVSLASVLKEPPFDMGIAFDSSRANFTRMARAGHVFISDVIHKTFISVDEKGTEAAAATSVRMAGNSLPPEPQFYMAVQYPFVFVIRDPSSNLVLFLGSTIEVSNPRFGGKPRNFSLSAFDPAAATRVTMSKSARPGLPEIPDFSMIVDHPFLVLVRAPPAHGHHLHHASAESIRGRSHLSKLRKMAVEGATTRIPEITIHADTPHAFGHAIGLIAHLLSAQITSIMGFIKTSQGENGLPFLDQSDKRCNTVFSRLVSANTKFYPNLAEEIRGMADGASLPVEYFHVSMLRVELSALMPDVLKTRQCTDFIAISEQGHLWHAHNEDWSPAIAESVFLVHADLNYPNTPRCRFAAYCYPGVLPGNTFAINEHGLSITTDALSPRHINPDGLGRYFVNRDALTATSIGDLIARIATATSADGGGPGRASGFCCNAVSYREGRAVNIEFAPSGHSVLELHPGEHTVHTNHYVRMEVPQHIGHSSAHRYARAITLPPIKDVESARNCLGDRGDAAYPIFRTATPPDSGITLASVVFDHGARRALIYVKHGDTLDAEPEVVWDMDRPCGDEE